MGETGSLHYLLSFQHSCLVISRKAAFFVQIAKPPFGFLGTRSDCKRWGCPKSFQLLHPPFCLAFVCSLKKQVEVFCHKLKISEFLFLDRDTNNVINSSEKTLILLTLYDWPHVFTQQSSRLVSFVESRLPINFYWSIYFMLTSHFLFYFIIFSSSSFNMIMGKRAVIWMPGQLVLRYIYAACSAQYCALVGVKYWIIPQKITGLPSLVKQGKTC